MGQLSRAPRPRVLVDDWYGWTVPGVESFAAAIDHWPLRLRRLVWRLGPVRAVALLIAARKCDAVAIGRRSAGWRSVLLLSALISPAKLVVLQLIDGVQRETGLGGMVDKIWRPLERWAMSRAVLRAQVLTRWEADLYPARFGLDRERICFVPFAWRRAPADAQPHFRPAGARQGVIAAGRTFCDWETLFRAAEDQDWSLTVVCPGPDRPLVDRLNHHSRATVLTDVPQSRVDELLQSSAISALAMRDAAVSQGHIRLCDSVEAGTPVVASRISSLEGYVEDGRTALLVTPGDAEELRHAINRLMTDLEARDQMARAAWDRGAAWTWEDYLAALAAFVHGERASSAQATACSAVEGSGASSWAGAPDPSRREITLDTPSPPMETP